MRGSIDVVIPAFNRWDLTHGCLEHLAAQTAAHRVIVVDNGSTDETSSALARDWPAVSVLALQPNHPFTQAVNRGVAAGHGEYVVILNNDVELHADFLEHLTRPLEDDPGIGSVASLMLAPGERLIDSAGVTSDVTLAGFARLQGLERRHASDAHPALTGPEGTAAAYRRSAWEQVGGLDEGIEAYMEILDLAWRLRSAGWRTACAPQAVGMHLGSATFGRRSRTQRRLAGFSRGYLLRRYGVLRGRHAARALATEALIVAADAALARDVQALTGRVAGWRSARGLERRPWPPADALDRTIGVRESIALRRGAARGS